MVSTCELVGSEFGVRAPKRSVVGGLLMVFSSSDASILSVTATPVSSERRSPKKMPMVTKRTIRLTEY